MSNLFPYLPAFLDLAGRAAVLLSGEAALAGLARRLMDGGAGVTIFDKAPSEAMAALAPGAKIVPRRWRTSDMHGAAFVAAGAGEPRRLRARIAAKGARAIFYMEGEPDFSDVAFGAAGGQGPLAIGVAAAGLPSAVQEAVVRRIESVVPEGYAGFLAAAAALESEIETALLDAAPRQRFWREAAEAAFTAQPGDWRVWLRARVR